MITRRHRQNQTEPIDYENWGCETLDLGNPRDIEIDNNILWLPMELVEQTVDISYIANISRTNQTYINELAASIKKHGQKRPGVLVLSPLRLKLQDGNHRFAACKQLGKKEYPVTLQFTDGKVTSGLSTTGIVKEYLYDQRTKVSYR